jgi:hypothetical protein
MVGFPVSRNVCHIYLLVNKSREAKGVCEQLHSQGSASENNEHLLHKFQHCVTTPVSYNQVFQQRVSTAPVSYNQVFQQCVSTRVSTNNKNLLQQKT